MVDRTEEMPVLVLLELVELVIVPTPRICLERLSGASSPGHRHPRAGMGTLGVSAIAT
jgi:hypothetical protein